MFKKATIKKWSKRVVWFQISQHQMGSNIDALFCHSRWRCHYSWYKKMKQSNTKSNELNRLVTNRNRKCRNRTAKRNNEPNVKKKTFEWRQGNSRSVILDSRSTIVKDSHKSTIVRVNSGQKSVPEIKITLTAILSNRNY